MSTDPGDERLAGSDLLIETTPRPGAGQPAVTGSVLLVDDDEAVRETLGAVVARDGHRVVTAGDLASAVGQLRDGHFDVLVVDLRLGQQDGFAVLREALALDPDVVGIVITGYATLESAIEALKGGAFSYLLKPCDPADLRQAITAGLHRRALVEARRLEAQVASEREARRLAQRAMQRVARLQELTAQLSSSLSTAEVLDQVVRAAVELLESPTAAVFLSEGEQDDFHLVAARGLDPDKAPTLPRIGSLAARASGEGRTIAIADVRRERDIKLPALIGGKSIGALVVAPVRTPRGILGVIEVYAPRPHRWQPDETDLLLALASAAGIAIDNARLHEAMQQAILTRDHVMASVSHDLKNPIAAISGNLQMLDSRLERIPEAYSPEMIRSELQRIRRLVLSMSGFLDELVETMRLEIGGQVELHRAHVDLSDLAADVVAIVQPTTTNHQLRLSARRPVIGLWDGNRLERVILNVVSNAIKYSPGGGDIEIDVEQAGSEAVVAVTDHGIGISREDLERVFEPFRRGSNVGDISGTGLGLAGARRIVEMHQGSMAVESVEGEGARFVIRLPLEPPAGG